ncbi:MAG: UDP-N-acetylglucosamine 4,6-dehydratase (inverting) [Phycisphaerae bacterium]|nr:UDP-N-acetylglucosamine 4,6-dehydratase (inverting) [Phycisphaerae bacterium]|tara:strand:+ start:71 stop:1078 length:1008 start_codon:yes stop_codon:yes gene_type:complete
MEEKKNFLNNKSILITGGTGSFGKKCIEFVLSKRKVKRLVVFSRDELKQFELSKVYPEKKFPIRYFIGDIRDSNRLHRACNDIDYIIHAAAMKRVAASEYNPTECISTNIIGAQNLIDAALNNKVKKVIALSTDKAANPVNLYGATKLCSDKLFVSANNLSGKSKVRFSIVRYGNVISSRGSVIPFFKELIKNGEKVLPLTDEKMTRFVISLEQGVRFVIESLKIAVGGEIFVPKIPSIKITDLVEAMLEKKAYKIVGIGPGEKLHEVMIPKEEARNCIELKEKYIITPQLSWWNRKDLDRAIKLQGKKVRADFEYTSENNCFMTVKELKKLIKK